MNRVKYRSHPGEYELEENEKLSHPWRTRWPRR